jgi:RNA polymerase-binding protein DksA
MEQVRRELLRDREDTVRRQQALSHDLADVVAAASDVATDDEHDPEGATIAYERARTAALVDQAADHIADIDHALERIGAGTYGVCDRCGNAIASQRLMARPIARTCIDCATRKR